VRVNARDSHPRSEPASPDLTGNYPLLYLEPDPDLDVSWSTTPVSTIIYEEVPGWEAVVSPKPVFSPIKILGVAAPQFEKEQRLWEFTLQEVIAEEAVRVLIVHRGFPLPAPDLVLGRSS
jgi:hypothetical protein